MLLMVTSMHLPCGRSLKCVQDSAYYIKISTPLFFFFFLVCHCFSFLLFSQCQLLFLAPFLPITYCNSLEKWGPCGTVFEKEAKKKFKANGNKLTCPVPPLRPTLVLQMPVRHSSPQSRIFTRWGKVISVAPCAI